MKQYGVHLNALRAFEAAARLSSFSRAAEELSVSHSTISHHISSLEAGLGVKLFERQNRTVKLTEAGAVLLPQLSTSFDGIKSALKDIRTRAPKKSLNVAVTPSFANKWLVPRLRDFQEQHPEIDINIRPSLAMEDYDRQGIHIGIRAGLGHWDGLNSELLMPIHMTPVIAPSLLANQTTMTDPSELLQHTLIHADVSSGVGFEFEWLQWFRTCGMTDVKIGTSISFHDPGLAIEAAINGLGIAIGYLELAKEDLKKGSLIRPFDISVQHPWSYHIVRPEIDSEDRQTALFCEWLRRQAQSS